MSNMAILFISAGVFAITFMSNPAFLAVVYTSTAKLSGLGRDLVLSLQSALFPEQSVQREQRA